MMISISINRKLGKMYIEDAIEEYNRHYHDLAMFSPYQALELYLKGMLIQ